MTEILKIDGVKEVETTFGTVALRVARKIARRVVVGIAKDVRDDVRAAAREVVERLTGRLFKAIRHKRDRGRKDELGASVIVNLKAGTAAIAPHWHFVEFGTVKQKASPFIGPTAKKWEAQLPRVYRERFGRQLEIELAKAT